MTDSAAYIKTAFFLPTGTTAIKFSQIREMYGNEAGTDHASTTFSDYLRDADIVTSTSYKTGGEENALAAGNDSVTNIPTAVSPTTPLKMSQFRGVAKEFQTSVSGTYTLTATTSGTNKRIKRLLVESASAVYTTGESGVGFTINSSDTNTIYIIHNQGIIGGGPGHGGGGGLGGDGGTGGTAGTGSTSYIQGGDGGVGDNGGNGGNGSIGSNGGHCLKIVAYPTTRKLYLLNEGSLHPGGGGGGGSGAGGGSGGGGGGGGGGIGSQGTQKNPASEQYIDYYGYGGTPGFGGSGTYMWIARSDTKTSHIWWDGAANSLDNGTRVTPGNEYTTAFKDTNHYYSRGTHQHTATYANGIFFIKWYALYRSTVVNGGSGGNGATGRPGHSGYSASGRKGAYYNGSAKVNAQADHVESYGNGQHTNGTVDGSGGGDGTPAGANDYYPYTPGDGGDGGYGGRSRYGLGYDAGGGGGDYATAGNSGGDGITNTTNRGYDGEDGDEGSTSFTQYTGKTLGGNKGNGGFNGTNGSGTTGGSGGSVLSGTATSLITYEWS
tara:strand:- start:74 stop:1723 length:1650 start_codon:yes stop_codon:yes gene_type:complete